MLASRARRQVRGKPLRSLRGVHDQLTPFGGRCTKRHTFCTQQSQLLTEMRRCVSAILREEFQLTFCANAMGLRTDFSQWETVSCARLVFGGLICTLVRRRKVRTGEGP